MKLLKPKVKYKALVEIYTPNGIAKKGFVATGEQWKNIMVYDVGSSIPLNTMFKEVKVKTVKKK